MCSLQQLLLLLSLFYLTNAQTRVCDSGDINIEPLLK